MDEEHISLDKPLLDGNERKYLNRCIDTNWISWQGEFVGKTEALLAKYCNTRHCLTIVNGTYALILALQALGIGPGDEVIVPALTMSATAFAVTSVGAKVVWADSTKGRLTVSPDDVSRKISSKTKAVMAVHLYGWAVEMEPLLKITESKGIAVVEDVAEGLGTSISGRKAGGMGTIACHSFHNKIVASGEGGAITCNEDSLAEKLTEMRTPPPNNDGSKQIALNHRMSNISCAVALAQLERIEDFVARRRKVAQLYTKYFQDVTGISFFKEMKGERCAYWRYQISLTDDYPLSMNDLVLKLREHNIEARPIFSLMSNHPYYKSLSSGDYPNSVDVSKRSVDLPSGPKITEEQVKRVAELIRNPGKL